MGFLKKRFSASNFIHTVAGQQVAKKRFEKIEKEFTMKKIIISHYRVGWTDGVSLEIEKRKTVLEELGYRVILIAGPGSNFADYIIDELDFERNDIKAITKESFGFGFSEQTINAIEKISRTIEEKLFLIIEKEKPVFILTHNIFSHGRHIAAAKAFASVLKKSNIPSLTTHHDFFWEREDFRTPSSIWVENYLQKFVPPEMVGLKHAVINTLAARSLENKRNIKAMIFPDTIDFRQKAWKKDDYNSSLLEDFKLRKDDIIFLQATRIVKRKGIELIPPIIKELQSEGFLKKLRGQRLYNGKRVTENSRIVFLIAGYAEHEAGNYKTQLEKMMKELKIEYRFLQPFIGAERGKYHNKKVYSLFDIYPHADFITYPSVFEGWGNQFLEAVFSKTPVLLNEYPVYKSDIKKIGYKVVAIKEEPQKKENGLYSISAQVINDCAEEIVDWLLSKKTPRLLEENYQLAKDNNSFDVLRNLINQGMDHLSE